MSNFNEMSANTKNKAKKLYNQGKEESESLAQQITEGSTNLYEKGKRKVTDLENRIDEYTEELTTKVQEKPLTSLLIAAGVGFLLSHLLKK